MILLDTIVLSEPLRPTPDPGVVAWLDEQAPETLFLSAVSLAEIRFGIAALPAGRRRDRLFAAFETQVLPLFDGRVLAFDDAAASAYAHLRAEARSAGVAIAMADAMIAAIALTHGFAVASRDVGPYLQAGLTVIDPVAPSA